MLDRIRTAELGYSDSDEEIHRTLQSFSEAWYSGDVKKAEGALHSKYAASMINDKSQPEKVDLLKFIKNGVGSNTPREVRNRMITIYESKYEKATTARLMFRDQIHYLHLVNENGQWKILSDLIVKKEMHG